MNNSTTHHASPGEIPAAFAEVFEKMDAYRLGKISAQEYLAIPRELLLAARQWRIDRTNRWLEERYPDLDL